MLVSWNLQYLLDNTLMFNLCFSVINEDVVEVP